MIIATTIDEVRRTIKEWKSQGLIVGLVPTMGALHEGHASLVTAAAEQCDRVVASVFVNPTQFSEGEDLDKYPRDFEGDCRLLEERGCHMVFHPNVEEMYPDGFATYVNIDSPMTATLCGRSRSGHFRGVCTVVSKLFNIAAPDKAYFGQKDAQQLAVIKQMVRDMAMDIDVVGCPTVREADGLAKSSRNAYLSAEERKAAGVVYRAIKEAESFIREHGADDEDVKVSSKQLVSAMKNVILTEPMARIDYIEAVDGVTLTSKDKVGKGDLAALAVYIGKTRLIDNFTIGC